MLQLMVEQDILNDAVAAIPRAHLPHRLARPIATQRSAPTGKVASKAAR